MKRYIYVLLLAFALALTLAGCAARSVRGTRDDLPKPAAEQDAKLAATRNAIDAYKTALGLYHQDNGSYPTTKEGLVALIDPPKGLPNWKGPYLDPPMIKRDPWGRSYVYRQPGEKNPNSYDLFSLGPDGVEGTEDDINTSQ